MLRVVHHFLTNALVKSGHDLLRLETILGKSILDCLPSQERPHLTPEHFHAWCFLWASFSAHRGTWQMWQMWHPWTLGMAPKRVQTLMGPGPSAFHRAAGQTLLYHLKGLDCAIRGAAWWHISPLWLYCTELKKRVLFPLYYCSDCVTAPCYLHPL